MCLLINELFEECDEKLVMRNWCFLYTFRESGHNIIPHYIGTILDVGSIIIMKSSIRLDCECKLLLGVGFVILHAFCMN